MKAVLRNDARERMQRLQALHKERLTPEEKARWEGVIIQTWQGIAPYAMQVCREGGAQRITTGEIIEYVMTSLSNCWDLTPHEYDFLAEMSSRYSGNKWLRDLLKGYAGSL